MADDPGDPDAAAAPDEAPERALEPTQDAAGSPELAGPPEASGSPAASAMRTRTLLLWTAFLAPAAVIALGLLVIVKSGSPRGAAASLASAAASASASEPPSAVAALLASGAPPLDKLAPAEQVFDEEGSDDKPSAKPSPPKHFSTVQQAALGSCTTESVDGLSRQIIEQARCIDPKALVPLPKRANLVLTPHVFPYLELEARDHLVRALDQHSALTMTVNSALRTVAQQYLVWRWAAGKTCGVQLATPPGESNHEIGAALDIAEAAKWRPALEGEAFHWLGASDRVHFDFKGSAAPLRTATDVLAFQKLWNKNHQADVIPENGKYDTATEQRLKKAPPSGFPLAPSCRGGKTHAR